MVYPDLKVPYSNVNIDSFFQKAYFTIAFDF
jgi:hypothetical protein